MLVIRSSLSLLLCLVNDMVDLKMIKEDVFTINKKMFSPLAALKYVQKLLIFKAKDNANQLSLTTVRGEQLRSLPVHSQHMIL